MARKPPSPRPDHPVERYARRVLNGEIVACKWVKLFCQRHFTDLDTGAARGLHFSVAKGERVLRFFTLLKHSKGEWAGHVFALEDWQRFYLFVLFGWLNADGTRRFRVAYTELPRKQGKSTVAAGIGLYLFIGDEEPGAEVFCCAPLALDTIIPTPSGWTTMGQLKVGEEVFDEAGNPTIVTYLSPILKDRPCFTLRFHDGESIVCDAEHRWSVKSVIGQSLKGRPRNEWNGGSSLRRAHVVKTTEQIRNNLKTEWGCRNFSVDVAAPLLLPVRDLPVKPYALGVWLGDGSSYRGAIVGHVSDREIVQYIETDGYTVSFQKSESNLIRYTVRGLRTELRRAGLITDDQLISSKHIPENYLRSSQDQRLALLQGLMDTDGTCTKTGECRFTNRNSNLAEGVRELALSLGLLAHIRSISVTGRPHYVVSFRSPASIPVFRLKRKHARQVRKCTPRNSRRYIVGVDPTQSVPVRCISVASASSLYLVGKGMIVTHNTKRDQAKIVWDEMARMVKSSAGFRKFIKAVKDNLSCERTNAKCEPLGSDQDTLDGLNPNGVIIDELHAHKNRGVWDVMTTATGARRQPLIFAITTAGYDRQSVCFQQHEYAEKVLEGVIEDDTFFGFVATLDVGDDWADPATWCLAGATELYVRLKRGITVCTIQALAEDMNTREAEVWDGRAWVRVLGASSTRDEHGALQIELASGERISCTGHHEWPTERGRMRADQLLVGDIIHSTTLCAPKDAPSRIDPLIGWLIGLYLAEGSRSGSTIQFSGHANENADRLNRISAIAESFGGSCHAHAYKNKGTVNLHSQIVGALIDTYIGGKIAKNKYLRPEVWRQNNDFLRHLAIGYLGGDGGYEKKNDRWKIGFTRNYRLAESLRTLAARLGASIMLKTGHATNQTKKIYQIHRGSWRWERKPHHGLQNYGKIVAIRKSSANRFFHIGVDNEDGLFCLASGVLTHNSKANLNLGVSVKRENLQAACLKAQQDPMSQNAFLRLRLNVWTNNETKWCTFEVWDQNAGAVDESLLEGRVCFGGLDLASTTDTASFVLAFPPIEPDGPVILLPRFWIPTDNMRLRVLRDRVPYDAWVRDGWMLATEGNIIDYDVIRQQILADYNRFAIQQIRYDRWGATQLSTQLAGDGLEMVTMGQGFASMSSPMKELMRRLLDKTIAHGGHPVLRWQASNVMARQDPAGNLKMDKAASRERIDGMVAAVMSLDGVIRSDASTYETAGLKFL